MNDLELIAGAGDLSGDYAPRLEEGEHVICVTEVLVKDTREKGRMIAYEAVILESTAHRKGEARGDAWFIGKPGTAGEYERKRANAFARAVVRSLGGDPDDATPVQFNGKTMKKGEVVVAQTLGKLLDPKQPGKGIVLRVSTRKRPNKDRTKEYDNNTYAHVTQTKEQIAEARKRIESTASSAPVAATTTTAAATPAPATSTAPTTTTAAPAAAQSFDLSGLDF